MVLLLACVGCRDQITSPQLRPAAGGSKLMGEYICTVEIKGGSTRCRRAPAEAGGARLEIYENTEGIQVEAGTSTYTPADSTVGIQIRIHNRTDLFAPPIGTPDGTLVTGIKAFMPNQPFSSIRAGESDTLPPKGQPGLPSWMGDGPVARVWARNPDGRMTFTRPDQPYWNYPEKLEYREATQWREWKFTVLPSVNTFNFAVSVYAEVPGESPVPAQPASGIPDWAYLPDSTATCTGLQPGRCSRRIVRLRFHPDAQQVERQIVIQAVSGTVVGGAPELGYYYVGVGGDGTLATLAESLAKLRAHPKVERAHTFDVTPAGLDSRFPGDGPGWQQWRVRPSQADGTNWGIEQVGGPLAWGCSVGDTATRVAVVDQRFDPVTDLAANVDTAASHGYNAYAGQSVAAHGTWVASIMAARGNNNDQITGAMWHARLGTFDVTVAPVTNAAGVTTNQIVPLSIDALWPMIVRAGQSGARVINVSVGARWGLIYTPGYNPATETNPQRDSVNRAQRHVWFNDFVLAMSTLAAQGHHPLVVFSAGNEGIPAEWNAARMTVDSSAAHGGQVIVVGATDVNRTFWSSSNHGGVVAVAAPGVSVQAVDAGGGTVLVQGTSFAAPHVSGTAGLLASFDPRLTAAEMKELIVSGARRGGLLAGTVPILNSYESLRGAGARPGAPLCGNPVYQDSAGKVFARRDTVWMGQLDQGLTRWEQLFTSAEMLPDVKHGGKRIRFPSGAGSLWTLNGTAASWSAVSATADTATNATARSKASLSHGRTVSGYTDTTVTVTKSQTGSTTTTRTERFQLFLNGNAHRQVDLVLSRKQVLPLQNNGCASWYVSDPTISNCLEMVPFGGAAWRDSVVTRATAAFSPAGDTIVLAVARDSFAFDVMNAQGNGNTWERPYGSYEATTWTDLYFVPVTGGGAPRGPVRIGRRIEALGLSENGMHLVAQIRDRFFARLATSNINNPAVRHHFCTAAFFKSDGSRVLTTPLVTLPYPSGTTPCVPGSQYAP